MTNHLIPISMFGISFIFLLVRLLTGKKRDFIISVFFIVLGSGISAFEIGFSSLYLFFAAIVASFVGDLLMAQWIRITEHRTIDGIMAFGLAHILYIIAFYQLNLGEFSFLGDWYLIVAGAVICYTLFNLTSTGEDIHPGIKFANGIYAIIITSMMIMVFAFVFAENSPLIVKLVATLGVLLFVISDTVLAYNEFQKPLPNAKEIIAVTYVLAQILLQLTPILTLFIYA